MPAASIDLTTANTYGANMGNFAYANALPGNAFFRSRLIKCSAIGGAGGHGACATVGYKIFKIPSYTLVQKVMTVVVKSASATMSNIAVGDSDASTTWISCISGTTLGPPTQLGLNTSWNLGLSILGPSHLLVGKFYSNGGEIQFAATLSEATLQFWVTVQGVNLTYV